MSEHRSFQDPDYAAACIRAIGRLRTEVYCYHDPKTPDVDDPDGVVNTTIKRLADLYWLANERQK